MKIFSSDATVISLLPYEASVVLVDCRAKLKLLILTKTMIDYATDALEFFFIKKELSKFDPQVGECLCQIRSYSFMLLSNMVFQEDEIDRLKVYRQHLVSTINQFKAAVYSKHDRFNPALDAKENLKSFLVRHQLLLTLASPYVYLTQCYFLSVFRILNSDGISMGIDYDMITSYMTISKTAARKIVKAYQKEVSLISSKFIMELAERIPKLRAYSENIDQLIRRDNDGRYILPYYLATLIIIEHMIITNQYALVIIKKISDKNKSSATQFVSFRGDSSQETFLTVENINPTIHDQVWLVIYCASFNNFHNENLGAKIAEVGLKNFVLANMAAHPQYSGEDLNHFNENPFAFLSKKDRAHFLLIEKELYAYKKMATMEGFSAENPKAFICHISSDTVLTPKIKSIHCTAQVILEKKLPMLKLSEGIINMATQLTIEKKLLFLERIIALIPGHVYWKDKNGVLLGCNDLQAKSAGLSSREEIVGKTDYDMPWKAQADSLRAIDQRVIETGQEVIIEELSELADGKKAVFLSKKAPLKNEDNQIIGVLGTSFDITERRILEEQLKEHVKKTEEALKSKMRFISIASHEIRGPVGNAISYSTLNEPVEAQLQEDIETLFTHLDQEKNDDTLDLRNKITETLTQLKNNRQIAISESHHALQALKNLSELYGFKMRNQEENIILLSITDAIELALKPFVRNDKKVTFTIEIDPMLSSDQVCINFNIANALKIIVGNAIRFSDSGEQVHISVRNMMDKVPSLAIAIEDHGCGMPELQLANLSNTFLDVDLGLQEHRYTKPSIQLSIAKAYLEAAGGKLKFTSKLDEGTTVTLEFPNPIQQNDHQDTERQMLNINANHDVVMNPEHLNLLLVEDDPLTLQFEKQQLESLGHHITTAMTGEKALEYLRNTRYDIVFIDITLPDKNGFEVVRLAKAETINAETPYIAVTSHSTEEDEDYFTLNESVTVVMSKPVSIQDFKECIDDILLAKNYH